MNTIQIRKHRNRKLYRPGSNTDRVTNRDLISYLKEGSDITVTNMYGEDITSKALLSMLNTVLANAPAPVIKELVLRSYDAI